MTFEEYNQLPYDYAHCAGTHCEKASLCLHHTAYTMPQFRSIIPCEILLYIEVTFLGFIH